MGYFKKSIFSGLFLCFTLSLNFVFLSAVGLCLGLGGLLQISETWQPCLQDPESSPISSCYNIFFLRNEVGWFFLWGDYSFLVAIEVRVPDGDESGPVQLAQGGQVAGCQVPHCRHHGGPVMTTAP